MKAAMVTALESNHADLVDLQLRAVIPDTILDQSIQSIVLSRIHIDLANEEIDVLVTLSQQSYGAFRGILKEGGTLFYESDLVQVEEESGSPAHGVGVTDIAFKQFGRKIMANMIMIGFVNGIAQLVSKESLERTIEESVPRGTEEKNLAAFAEGMRLAAERMGKTA